LSIYLFFCEIRSFWFEPQINKKLESYLVTEEIAKKNGTRIVNYNLVVQSFLKLVINELKSY